MPNPHPNKPPEKKTKVEQFGLEEEVLKLKGKGLGSVRISKVLTQIAGEPISSSNVDNFLKSLNRNIDKNKSLAAKVDNAVSISKLNVLGQWKKLDAEFDALLSEANKMQIKILKDGKGNPIKLEYKDLRLWKDVLSDIAKASETRARILGQIQSGVHITMNIIENQYNDLKQIVINAEDKFPGIGDYVEDEMLSKENKS